MGVFSPVALASAEILERTQVGFGGIVLALASGAAAVLSLTTGLSSALVGVMVAVALLPPAVTLGMMAGAGDMPHALGAALLLGANVICVNLAAQVVFVVKRLGPRTALEKLVSRRTVFVNIVLWSVLLAGLLALIGARG